MATPARNSNRWGSLLQQAVAGVEARLDTILTEGEENAQAISRISNSSQRVDQFTESSKTSKPAPGNNRTQSRLQARLARAVANKSTSSDAETESSVTTNVENDEKTSNTASTDATRIGTASITRISSPVSTLGSTKSDDHVDKASILDKICLDSGNDVGTPSSDIVDVEQPALRENRDSKTITASHDPVSGYVAMLNDDGKEVLDELRADHKEELAQQYERIDALEAKLNYLTKELSESARSATLAAPRGSITRKLAENDERIALLIQEGQQLAANDQKQRILIRKLRAIVQTSEKQLATAHSARDAAISEMRIAEQANQHIHELETKLEDSNERARCAEETTFESMRQLEQERIKSKNLEQQLKLNEVSSPQPTAGDMPQQPEMRIVNELEEKLATTESEKNAITVELQGRIDSLEKDLASALQKAQNNDTEKAWQIKNLEGQLERMRAQAEDVSSSQLGELHLKLGRQVETLQSQYAIASKNWEGIESSLLSKLAGVEKERDDALCRESEVRKRARETAQRLKKDLDEIEQKLMEKSNELDEKQRILAMREDQLQSLQKRADEADERCSQMKADFDKQLAALPINKPFQVDHDRRNWLEELPVPSTNDSRPSSPLPHFPLRTVSSDLVLLQGLNKSRSISTPGSLHEGGFEMSIGRRSSNLRLMQTDDDSHSLNLATSPVGFSNEPHFVQSPSLDDRERVSLSLRPDQQTQDLMSVSTAAAGPSVQLVERMSATVRRLEAEKVTTKEELTRVSSQRDEARAEIMTLMKQVRSQRAAAARVVDLETEVADINSRYQTTLEMLGEKSELVEELRADVQDVKAMYRELVERTIK